MTALVAVVAALVVGTLAGAGAAHIRATPDGDDVAAALWSRSAVVTVEQARQAFESFWPLRERALFDGDIASIDRLETGVAREYDRFIALQVQRGLGNVLIRPHYAVEYIVPHQSTFPARFLASVSTTGYGAGAPQVDLMVFVRTEPQSSWLLALYTGWTGSLFRPATVEGSDLASATPVATVDPAAPHRELARYFQYWKDHQAAPEQSPLKAGPFTTSKGESIATVPQGGISSDPCRCPRLGYYTPDANTYEFTVLSPSVPGSAGPIQFICGTIRVRVESRPSAADRRLYQDPAQANWGAPLEPGLYSVITEELVRQSCILVIEPDLWDVVGETGDLVSISGVA